MDELRVLNKAPEVWAAQEGSSALENYDQFAFRNGKPIGQKESREICGVKCHEHGDRNKLG